METSLKKEIQKAKGLSEDTINSHRKKKKQQKRKDIPLNESSKNTKER